MTSDQVFAKRKNIQICKCLHAAQVREPVIEKTQISELGQIIQVFNLFDEVEAEIEPLQVNEMVQILNLGYNVVVQLQLNELVHTF